MEKNKKEISNDELWKRSGQAGSISKEELGIKNNQETSGYQVINEGVNLWAFEYQENK